MKKTLTIMLAFACFTITSKAQITISNTSFPNVGDVSIKINDTLPSIVSAGSSGANQIWNFAMLHNHATDSSFYLTPSSTPNGILFPSSNLAVKQAGNNYAYFNKTVSKVDLIGFSGDPGIGYNLDINFSTPAIISVAGNTFNSSYNFDNSSITTVAGATIGQPMVDSVRIHRDNYASILFDGWGTVSNPLGSYPCLRMHEHDSIVLVIDIFTFGFWQNNFQNSTNIENNYQFVDNNSIAPLVRLNMDSTNNMVVSASYRLNITSGLTETLSEILFSLYPNPVSGFLTIHLNQTRNAELKIYDLFGREIVSQQLYAENTSIDFSKQPGGIYRAEIIYKDKTLFKKFIKQ